MKVINRSQLSYASMAWQINPPQHSVTFIVKGAFKISPNNEATQAEEQCLITGCIHFEDDEEKSCYYDSDLAYFKPHTDLLLVGTCYSPTKELIKACPVTFQVGNHIKSLNVFGDRYRYGPLNSVSTPMPFTQIALRYENSYGGSNYTANPLGKGHSKQNNQCEEKWPLPNIEDPDYPLTASISPPEPAGFGPLDPMWQQRYSKLGTYNKQWLKNRWPYFPEDFNWQHFNAAPKDMQVAGYINGDESLYFENLHPEHSQYHAKLPGLRVRCFSNEKQNQENSYGYKFREIAMNLDTLWVDMDQEKLAIVWRGFTSVLSDEYDEIEHLLIVTEKLTSPPYSVEHYQTLLEKELVDNESDKSAPPLNRESKNPEFEQSIKLTIAKAEEQMRSSIIAAGLDPDNFPEPSDEDKDKEVQLLKEMGIKPVKPKPTRELIKQRISNNESFEAEDLRGIDLSNMNLNGINFMAAILTDVNFSHSDLSHANLAEATLDRVNFAGSRLTHADLTSSDCTQANFANADLSNAQLSGAHLEQATLTNVILNKVIAKNADLSQADLTHASCQFANFQGADLSKCLLHHANFEQADLSESCIEGAEGHQVNMSKANLTELQASEGCDFYHGNFQQAIGFDSIWEQANLAGADFSHSVMVGANFTKVNFDEANLHASDMKHCRFNKASLVHTQAQQMNLFQSSLEHANLAQTNLQGSNCYQAEFYGANISNTNFLMTNLNMTRFKKATITKDGFLHDNI